jgi:hypothetical protein
VLKVFGTRDIVEEYMVCKCFPVREGWSISSWAGKEKCVGSLPMPNFSMSFGIIKYGEFFFNLVATFADVNPMAIEALADKVLGAEACKEHMLLKDKLGGT